MIDSATRKPIKILANDTAGPYIMVPLDQLEQVRSVLRTHDIPHWVEHNAISVDGRPAIAVINLGKMIDAPSVQALLDAA